MPMNDLTPDAQEGFPSDLPTPVEKVAVPQSEAGQDFSHSNGQEATLFEDPSATSDSSVAESFFAKGEVPEQLPVPATALPTLTQMLAISMAEEGTLNPLTVTSLDNLQSAQQLINSQKEVMSRLQIANRQIQNEGLFLANLKKQMQGNVQTPVSSKAVEMIDKAYNSRLQQNVTDRAKLALEQETIERVEDFLTNGNAHEAQVALDRVTKGTAEDRIRDNRIKDLILMQRIEEAEAAYSDSGWIRGFMNGLLRAVPFKENADSADITFDAGLGEETSWWDFFFGKGNDYLKQGETIYDLNNEDFANFMAKDGPFMSALADNAGLFFDDPTKQLEIMKDIFDANQQDRDLANVWSTVDTAFSIPVATGTKVLLNSSARTAATNQLARTISASVTEGADAAKALTGLSAKDVAAEMSTKALNPSATDVSLGADVVANLKAVRQLEQELPQIIGTSRFTKPEELTAAFEAAEKLAKERFGKNLKDVDYLEIDAKSGTAAKWQGDILEGGDKVHRLEVVIGKVDGGGYANSSTAKNTAVNKFGVDPSEVKVVKDSSGQHFAKFNVVVKEEGFVTSPLKTPDVSFARFFRSSDRIADTQGIGKGLVGGNSANLFNSAMVKALRSATKGVSRKDKNSVDQIIRAGQNEGTWFTRDEFILRYQRLHGEVQPSENVIEMYNVYRRVSDLAYVMRNRSMYVTKHAEGYESVKFPLNGTPMDVDGVINYTPTKYPTRGKVFDVTRNRHLDKDTDITKLGNDGYSMVKLDRAIEAPDGRGITHIMVKNVDLEVRPLRPIQLAYSMGGSRAYSARYFVKQATRDSGGSLLNPNVFIAGKNRNEMNTWTDTMNEALRHVRENPAAADEVKLDEILSRVDGAPTGREFLDLVDAKKIDLSHDLKVVYDREMPDEYFGQSPEALGLVDEFEDPVHGYLRSHGRMYYSSKGEHLKDYTGDFAETIDPWETLNANLTEAARTSSLSGYKTSMAERFQATYGNFVKGDNNRSLYDFVNAPLKEGLSSKLVNQIRNEQIAMTRILRYESAWEKSMKNSNRVVSEWVLGAGRAGSFREKAYDWTLALQKNNPVEFIRGLAFDANLGFFNIGQLFIQSSTMVSATALNPRYGFKGIAISYPMLQWRLSGYSDNVLDLMAKRGMHRGGFDTEEEFKQFFRMFRDSGVDEVGGATLSQIREFGTQSVYGAASQFDALREKGRLFFYQAERFNRTTAARIAWGEMREAGIKPGTSRFREEFLRLTNDYSMSMMAETSAGFQHGLASIPTQFWAYSFRMMEAMVGSRFTPAQKMRLVLANGLMAGTAGVPAGFLVEKVIEEYNGEPTSIEGVDGWIERGIIDGLVHATTGADVRIGDKVGTADLIPNAILDVFNMGQYGDKSMGEILLGATGSKVGSAIPVFWDAVKYSASEAGGEDLNGLSSESWMRLAKEIQTVNFIDNAYIASQYGIFQSKSGLLVDSNLPPADAFFFALGFNPAAMEEASYYMDKSSNEKERIEEAAKLVSRWRQEAFTNPDRFEENREKVSAFLGLYDPSFRARILEKASTPHDPSFVDSVKRRWEESQTEARSIDMLAGEIEKNAE